MSVRVQGEVEWGIDSQRKKGRDLGIQFKTYSPIIVFIPQE